MKGADGKTFKVTKGAPQVILGLSENAAVVKDAVDKAVDDFAKRGFRALGRRARGRRRQVAISRASCRCSIRLVRTRRT